VVESDGLNNAFRAFLVDFFHQLRESNASSAVKSAVDSACELEDVECHPSTTVNSTEITSPVIDLSSSSLSNLRINVTQGAAVVLAVWLLNG